MSDQNIISSCTPFDLEKYFSYITEIQKSNLDNLFEILENQQKIIEKHQLDQIEKKIYSGWRKWLRRVKNV